MLNFCDFIQVFVFTRNHHLKEHLSIVTWPLTLIKSSRSSNPLGTGGNQAKGSKDISILVKFHLFMSSCHLENEVKVTKI